MRESVALLAKEITAATGGDFGWFDYQVEFLEDMADADDPVSLRACLYYRTGAGKSLTALAGVKLLGHHEALVITPPSTHRQWVEAGESIGVQVECMSHAKFRMKGTLLKKDKAVIADEFHMFGGHKGAGWSKLDRLSAGLKAPLILASATPNYNDAERVYCVQHILDPAGTKGGYLAFLYQHCKTEANAFSMTPDVVEFWHYDGAAAFLADLSGVYYLADDLVYSIQDHPVQKKIPPEMEEFGFNRRRSKMVASTIEKRHAEVDLSLINDVGLLKLDVWDWLRDLIADADTPVLIFAMHSTVAVAIERRLFADTVWTAVLVTGDDSTKRKNQKIKEFVNGNAKVCIGTASLATGTDGLDKMCNTLVIVDDTDDDAQRRQLIGRIMPRGKDSDATKKHVHRLVLT